MRSFVFGIVVLSATPAAAEVVSSSPNGFEVRETINLVVPANIAFQSFAGLRRWWDPEHTHSGKSSNLSLNDSPGGCYRDRFPDGGGIEHMRVAYVEPANRV